MTDPQGTPIWFELNTPDAEAAARFYAALAGWRSVTSPVPAHGGYRVAMAGEDGVAGIMAAAEGMGLPGWTIYLAVDDVDAIAQRIATLGGTVRFGPADIPEVGRFAAVADPQGVGFSIMRGASDERSAAFRPMAGDAGLGHGVWIELATPDPDAAFRFYGALFGWQRQGGMPMGAMGDYAFLGPADGEMFGAVMSSTLTGTPPGWGWYVQVADIDAAVAAATGAGGRVVRGPEEIPGGAFTANLIDAQGSAIGVVGPRAGTEE